MGLIRYSPAIKMLHGEFDTKVFVKGYLCYQSASSPESKHQARQQF
jgi:hypothetical protein